MKPTLDSTPVDLRIDPGVYRVLAMISAGLEDEIRRLVEAPPPNPLSEDLDWESILEARWEALGSLLVDHARPLSEALRELAAGEGAGHSSPGSAHCLLAIPAWYALEGRGLRETFLLAACTAAERERLERWVKGEFERLLERNGFAADHASTTGALLAAAGRDLAYLAALLGAAAEDELAERDEAVRGKRQLVGVRQATRALDRLAGKLAMLASSFENEASEQEGNVRPRPAL